jgi:hypothetical protein
VDEKDFAVALANIRGELMMIHKDIKRVEDAADKCLRFQSETNRTLSNHVSETGNARRDYTEIMKTLESFKQLEVKTRMDMIEAFVSEHKKDHGESHKTAQAKQWALWLVLITTGVSSIAGLIIKIVMG